jgi:hypothetical protein
MRVNLFRFGQGPDFALQGRGVVDVGADLDKVL